MNTTIEEQAETKIIHFMNDAMAKSIFRSKELRTTVSKFLSGVTHIPSNVIARSVFM